MRSRPVGQVSRSQSDRQPSGRRLVTRCGFDRNLRGRRHNGAGRNRLEYRSMRRGSGPRRRQGRQVPRLPHQRQDRAGGDARRRDDAAAAGVGGRPCRWNDRPERRLARGLVAWCRSSRPRPSEPGGIRFRMGDGILILRHRQPILISDSSRRSSMVIRENRAQSIEIS